MTNHIVDANKMVPPPHLLKKFSEQARVDSKKRGHSGYCKTFAKLCIDWALNSRAALAQPEPEGVVTPTLPGGVPLTGGLWWLIPTLDDVVELCDEFGFELHEDNESGEILWEMFRAVLARWGTPNPITEELK